jgi:AcrR family transcriptional regulator
MDNLVDILAGGGHRMALKRKQRARPIKRAGGTQLGRPDWIRIAKSVLIKEGFAAVKIERIAALLKVTVGSFYWHFSGRPELYEAIIADWLATNTKPLEEAVRNAGFDPRLQYLAFFGVWVLERNFDPAYDNAIRIWSQTSPKIGAVVTKVEHERIAILFEIFRGFGYADAEAQMRARITYYHQVGYYALKMKEPTSARVTLAPMYAKILCGFDWMGELAGTGKIELAMQGKPIAFTRPLPQTKKPGS